MKSSPAWLPCFGWTRPRSTAAIDSNPGSAFDLVRVAQDVDKRTAQLISEAGFDLPGVEVAVEARRQYTDGPLMSQILGYTGPVSAEQLADLAKGLPAGRPARQGGAGGRVRDRVAWDVRLEASRATRRVVERRYSRRSRRPSRVRRLRLTIDTKTQRDAQKALKWAMKKVGMTRGVVIAMNPQTGEILAMVSLPTYDNNKFARGISNTEYKKLLQNKDKPLLNHAIQAHYAPGSTYKLVTGTGALADGDITRPPGPDEALPDARRDEVLRVEPPWLGPVRHLLRFRSLE